MVNKPLALTVGRAAMYVRMSTEHQQYSTQNQTEAIEALYVDFRPVPYDFEQEYGR
jgi:DNA invertase Pin-like site-specific DNA recombinase